MDDKVSALFIDGPCDGERREILRCQEYAVETLDFKRQPDIWGFPCLTFHPGHAIYKHAGLTPIGTYLMVYDHTDFTEH